MNLPRELWIYILEIKWWTARKNRLVNVLNFPELCEDENHVYGVGKHRWLVYSGVYHMIDGMFIKASNFGKPYPSWFPEHYDFNTN